MKSILEGAVAILAEELAREQGKLREAEDYITQKEEEVKDAQAAFDSQITYVRRLETSRRTVQDLSQTLNE